MKIEIREIEYTPKQEIQVDPKGIKKAIAIFRGFVERVKKEDNEDLDEQLQAEIQEIAKEAERNFSRKAYFLVEKLLGGRAKIEYGKDDSIKINGNFDLAPQKERELLNELEKLSIRMNIKAVIKNDL